MPVVEIGEELEPGEIQPSAPEQQEVGFFVRKVYILRGGNIIAWEKDECWG